MLAAPVDSQPSKTALTAAPLSNCKVQAPTKKAASRALASPNTCPSAAPSGDRIRSYFTGIGLPSLISTPVPAPLFNRLLSIFGVRRARKFPPSALSAVAVTLLFMWHACRHAGFAHHQFLAKIVDDPDVRPTSCKQARRSFPRQVGRQAARGQDRCAGAVVHAVGHLRASSDWVLQTNRRRNGLEPPWLPLGGLP